jgi:murein L,D-transpeptidase YafK
MKNLILQIIFLLFGIKYGFGQKIDSLVIDKSERKLYLFSKGEVVQKYRVSLGGSPKGPKTIEGDEKTPEGKYVILDKNPTGEFHKNLGINYPNKYDLIVGRTGGDIKIHGLSPKFAKWGKLQTLRDWTKGCIAVTNKQIDEIYDLVDLNTPISIYP